MPSSFSNTEPQELSDLNQMEIRLISLRTHFIKMVALPCDKQRGIHGPAVNVPTGLHPVCTLLLKLSTEAQVVLMKLKRKLCYKGHYIFQYVRSCSRVVETLYQDIQVSSNWEHDASQDDTELWEAFTSQHSAQLHSPLQQQSPQHQSTLAKNNEI